LQPCEPKLSDTKVCHRLEVIERAIRTVLCQQRRLFKNIKVVILDSLNFLAIQRENHY